MQVLTTAPSSPFPTGAFNSWMEMSDQRRTAQRRMRSAINEVVVSLRAMKSFQLILSDPASSLTDIWARRLMPD